MTTIGLISEESIVYLFMMIEEVADQVNDSYHYHLIKLIVRFIPQAPSF